MNESKRREISEEGKPADKWENDRFCKEKNKRQETCRWQWQQEKEKKSENERQPSCNPKPSRTALGSLFAATLYSGGILNPSLYEEGEEEEGEKGRGEQRRGGRGEVNEPVENQRGGVGRWKERKREIARAR